MPEPTVSTGNPPNWLNQPLAIVGMACRLPGADGLEAFWDLLLRGGCAIERMPDTKLDRARFFDSQKGKRGKTYSDIGGFVAEREIDWSLLNIEPSEAANWDECHLNLCEVAARACIDAGYDPRNLGNRNAGVFVGHSGGTTLGGDLAYSALLQDYVDLLGEVPGWQSVGSEALQRELLARLRADRPKRRDGKPWVDAGFASGLIARSLGLTGPHMSIDAACASSLVALALGAMSLHSGQTDMAIVGGASYNKSDSLILFSAAQSCSADGTRPFDQAANGLVSSEGYVTILIKRVEQAIADGDRIHAVIRGIGISSDGRGRSLWAPRKEGQREAIARAYSGDVDPASVQMIEAHATSTQVGDATEMEALASFYQQYLAPGQKLPVGSVKSNIGHTLESAGLAGLVKSVLSIQHGIVPPSINVEHPSESIPWDSVPFYVPRQPESWPTLTGSLPRRAAVNAFGIGGLNVHVVVEQASAIAKTASANVVTRIKRSSEPIAIVGRGLVLPGAIGVAAFKHLLGQSSSSTRCASAATDPSCFVDFNYDWRKHKVPPKQVAQANPLQFMLLEAAEQAMQEAGLLEREFNRSRTAVVVGTVFGGDFGNALYAGLRLPEFRYQLLSLMAARGIGEELAEQIANAYEERFLKRFPALLDETGSFTSSTLASRIAKTFDLMGGAMAIDAGDVSSLAALQVGCQLLSSGSSEIVLCATAQRALDRAALENLDQCGRLRSSHRSEGYQVGEGVALVLLKRLGVALKDGDKVLGTIDEIGVGFDRHSLSTSVRRASQRMSTIPPSANRVGALGLKELDQAVIHGLPSNKDGTLEPSTTLERVGHLQGAQGLVDVIASTVCSTSATAPDAEVVVGHTLSGQSFLATVNCNLPVDIVNTTKATEDILTESAPLKVVIPESFRFQASSRAALKAKLERLESEEQAMSVSRGGMVQAVIVADQSQLADKAQKAAKLIENAQAIESMVDQGVLFVENKGGKTRKKLVFLFPGQGSQYVGMLREIVRDNPTATRVIQEANEVLQQLGEPTFESIAWNESSQLGENVWHTQASILVADVVMLRILENEGLRPDLVAGHSFGEFAALVATGCWTFGEALRAAWHRCRSVVQHAPTGCSMLSIQAAETLVQQVIQAAHLPLAVSHVNTPVQTVVGGKQAAIAQLAQLLDDDGIVSRILPVPTAFHTHLLQPAVQPFWDCLQDIKINPPTVPLLSSVNNRFVADPDWIREGLAKQLVTPLRFVDLVERLVEQGATHAIEVGPQQVLTRLLRNNTSELRICSTDNLKSGTAMQLQVVKEFVQLHQLIPSSGMKDSLVTVPSIPSIVQFDATQTRRNRLRSLSSGDSASQDARRQNRPMAAPAHFDATELRRKQHRAESQVASSIEKLELERSPDCKSSDSVSIVGGSINSTELAAIEQFLTDFVVEQTGYPAEMIQLDWDLESELGIDSIKKAQLFGELREFFDLEMHAGLKLDNFRSLRQIAQLLLATPGKGSWLSSPESGDEQASVPVVCGELREGGNTSTTAETGAFSLEQFLIDFVVEQTGYPAEIVDLQADLEADLGIDSIKKAQLLGELRELFPEAIAALQQSKNESKTVPKLVAFRSLADIVGLLGEVHGHSSESRLRSPAPALPTELGSGEEGRPQDVPQSLASNKPTGPRTSFRLTQFLVDFIVEQTGYPEEIVELDADLEADLGIDSIKKAQMFGEIRELYRIDFKSATTEKSSLGDLRTLRQIVEMVEARLDQGEASAADLALAENTTIAAVDGPVSGHDDGVKTEDIFPLFHLNGNRDLFSSSVRENLRAMSARARGFETATLDLASKWWNTLVLPRVRQVAATAKVSPESVLALDRCLLESAEWKTVHASSLIEKQSIEWLAELCLPTWIDCQECFGLNPEHPEGSDSQAVEILLAGAVTPLAVIDPSKNLIVGGLVKESSELGEHAALQQQLSALLQRLVKDGGDYHSGLAKWRLPFDWWVFIACPADDRVFRYETRNRELSLSESPMVGFLANPEASATRIGWERSSKSWVMSFASHSGLYPVSRVPLKRDSRGEEQSDCGDSKPEVDRRIQAEGDSIDASMVHRVAKRFVLRMAPASQFEAPGRQPVWAGTAVVVGNNPVAVQLESRLRGAGVDVLRLLPSSDPNALAEQFAAAARLKLLPHLFLLSACDAEAKTSLDEAAWRSRKDKGVMGNFWLCQKWLTHIMENDLTDDASLISISTLGGDFGISGNITSVEGGGVGGLLKSMLIESWMQGIRSLPIKTIDTSPTQSPAEIVDSIWRELAIPSYDNEISYKDGIRRVVRAIAQPVAKNPRSSITRGGNWVCTGGARGITALAVERLAQRYGLTVNLLGTAPHPSVDPTWRELDDVGLRELKVQVMTQGRAKGKNPIKAWQDTEKQLEIDATLRRLREQGINAYYHQCDVADRGQLNETLAKVRQHSGPIHGVLHGAGVGRDSRFDRKQPEKVNQCISAKVDGAFNLMSLTQGDPLEAFIGFGSISGRFGANGHADYSLANDMLCKQMDWLKRQRPNVAAIGFHWHAWGDVGMATKPETKLALEMIDMQFMPAEEGVEHLIAELEGGAGESEVLITDERYYRAFYPAETLLESSVNRTEVATPLIQSSDAIDELGVRSWRAIVEPTRDPFLTEHQLNGRPLLPFVVASEMLLEAARAHWQSDGVLLRDIEAKSALRFFHDQPQVLKLSTREVGDRSLQCELRSDFVSQKGIVVDCDRLNFTATAVDSRIESGIKGTRVSLPRDAHWQRASYPAVDAEFYVGWPLQRLKQIAIGKDELIGRISAPALLELAGSRRDTRGWKIPSAAMDACLFAVGALAWKRVAPGSALPVRIGQLSLGRLPRPGEACEVHVQFNSSNAGTASFDFSLYGVNGDLILDAIDYEVAWLNQGASLGVGKSAHPQQG